MSIMADTAMLSELYVMWSMADATIFSACLRYVKYGGRYFVSTLYTMSIMADTFFSAFLRHAK